MSRDVLWHELLKPQVLRRGWHLARLDTRTDFAEDLYAADAFAHNLDINILEIINRLRTGTYQPDPILHLEVPKGNFNIRPGALIPIRDRVVLTAITALIAPIIDQNLPKDSVYSWRVKRPLRTSGPLFAKSDITDIPFLKKGTIRHQLDPFEQWYLAWPIFDNKSREAIAQSGFQFLATSDIAAYFENIQLPILRDALLRHLNDEHKIVNLVCGFLETWTQRTTDNRPHFRGIPQGNMVSSFLGNMFLLPLDEAITSLETEHDMLYFRYMDDVRIFTKRAEDALRRRRATHTWTG